MQGRKYKDRIEISTDQRQRAAELCRDYREKHNLSQRRMASILGCHQTLVSWLEGSYHTTPTWLVQAVLELDLAAASEVM